ncbi:hypothetical protein [Mucilaginibacter glaciei]|uniref:Uncharacterized protein n=1 Tax=Mucilaginibacter glaciei TaxID=2772109 RepID=A0A926NWG5_9SPHI|nr:hypothetical protein [Mucilaginibacter glaciei]MBD1395325.1 hypothetical protein [Mucilaginibacter glaciei]
MSDSNNQSTGPDGTIPVNDAITLTRNWRTYLAASQQGFIAQSFSIPIVDFQNILTYNPDAEAVRAYIGLESATDPLSAKLVLVPVVDGQDVLFIDTTTPGGVGGDPNSSNVYDLTNVCPPTCAATGSPLSE